MRNFQAVFLLISLILLSNLNIFAQEENQQYIFDQKETQPLTLVDIKVALKNYSKVPNCNKPDKINVCLADAIRDRNIAFSISPQDKKDLKAIDANEELITEISIQSSKVLVAEALMILVSKNNSEQDSQKAIDLVTKAIEQYESSGYYVLRGVIYDSIDKYELAISDFIASINLDNKGVDIYLMLGDSYYNNGQFIKAINSYKKALLIDKYSYEALYKIGKVNYAQGNHKDAIEMNKQALILNPNYGRAYFALGNIYENTKVYDKAIENYEKAIEAKFEFPWVYFILGYLYQTQQKYDDAIANYNDFIKLGSNLVSDSVYSNLGYIYYKNKDYEKAIENYKKAISLRNVYRNYFDLGNVYFDQENYSEAISNFQSTIELNPSFKPAYDKLELILLRQGKNEEAKKTNLEKNKIVSNNAKSDLNDLRSQKNNQLLLDIDKNEKRNFLYPSGNNKFELQNRTNPLNLNIIKSYLDPANFLKNPRCNGIEKANKCLIDEIKKRGILFDVDIGESSISPIEIQDIQSLGAYPELILLIKKFAALQNMLGAILIIEREKSEKTYKQALKLINDSINLYKHGRFYLVRGALYSEFKKTDLAIENLLEATELNFKPASLYYELGELYYNKKIYDKSLLAYKEAIRRNISIDEGEDVYYSVGLIYDDLGDEAINKNENLKSNEYYSLATFYYKKQIEFSSNFVKAYNNLGRVYYKQGKIDDAISNYKKAVELDENYYWGYYNLGYTYYQLKKYNEAVENFDKAIKIRQNSSNAYWYRGKSYEQLNRTAEAEADMKKYEELTKNQKP